MINQFLGSVNIVLFGQLSYRIDKQNKNNCKIHALYVREIKLNDTIEFEKF